MPKSGPQSLWGDLALCIVFTRLLPLHFYGTWSCRISTVAYHRWCGVLVAGEASWVSSNLATYQRCGLGQVTDPPWASAYLPMKRGWSGCCQDGVRSHLWSVTPLALMSTEQTWLLPSCSKAWIPCPLCMVSSLGCWRHKGEQER